MIHRTCVVGTLRELSAGDGLGCAGQRLGSLVDSGAVVAAAAGRAAAGVRVPHVGSQRGGHGRAAAQLATDCRNHNTYCIHR